MAAAAAGRYGAPTHNASVAREVGDTTARMLERERNIQQGRSDNAVGQLFGAGQTGMGNVANANNSIATIGQQGMANMANAHNSIASIGQQGQGNLANAIAGTGTIGQQGQANNLAALSNLSNAGQAAQTNVLNAARSMPAADAARYAGAKQLAALGAQAESKSAQVIKDRNRIMQEQQLAAWKRLQAYNAAIRGTGAANYTNSTQTTQTPTQNPLVRALGGAASLASLFGGPATAAAGTAVRAATS